MKNFSPYLFFALTIFFNALTSLAFKFASLKDYNKFKTTMWFITGLLFGLANIYYYVKSLKTFNLNIVYPIGVAANTIILTIIAYLLFKENITIGKSVGMVFIILGIFLISKF